MSSFQSFDPQFDSPYYSYNIDDSIIGKHPTFNRLQYINNCNKDSLNSVDILDTSNNFNLNNESIETNQAPVKYKSNLHRRFNLPKDDVSETLSQDSQNSINSVNSQDSTNSSNSVKSTDSESFSISNDLQKEHFNVISNKSKKEKNKEPTKNPKKDFHKHHHKDINYSNFKPISPPIQKPIQPIYINNSFPKFDYEKIKMFIICLLFGIITIILLNICFKIQLRFYLNKNKIPFDIVHNS